MRTLTWLSCLLWAWPVCAQPLLFQHLTVEDGLSDNAITCVLEDRDGHIWIGTENGLDRYDGQRVEHFTTADGGPQGAHITSLAQDGRDRLWIATLGGGLHMRDPVTGRFSHYHEGGEGANAFLSDQLNHVSVVNDSLLVIGTQHHGAIWYHTERHSWTQARLRPPERSPTSDTVSHSSSYWCHGTVSLGDDRLWVATLPATRTFITRASTPTMLDTIQLPDDPSFLTTNGLWLHDRLYVAGWSPGIHRIDLTGREQARHFKLLEEITCMVPWSDGMLLAGTKVGGLLLLDTAGVVLQRMHHLRIQHGSLGNDRVRCLLKDRHGNLWVGTANGLSVHAPASWRFRSTALLRDEDPGDLVFHQIQQDQDGTIRLSTSMGFFLVNAQTLRVRHVPLAHNGSPLEVTGLFEAGPGEHVLGTETGLFPYDPAKEEISSPVKNALPIGSTGMFQVRSVFMDTLNDRPALLIGVLGSAQDAHDASTGARYADWADHQARTGTVLGRRTLRDQDGSYWTASSGGIIHWEVVEPGEAPRAIHFDRSETGDRHLPVDDATSLLMAGGTLWAGLRGIGLVAIVDDKAQVHEPPPHMPTSVLGIAMDKAGRLWCTTNNGLLRFDPSTGQWLHVPVNDGGRFRQLSGAILTLDNGDIALGADDHLLLFEPAAFTALPPLPTPMLAEVQGTWGDLRGGPGPSLRISYRNSAFDARITALRPTGPTPLTFLYRLEGLEEAWRTVTGDDLIHYAGIPVGTHHLQVRVRDAYGREGPDHLLLTITVNGPIWQRWWFLLLCFVLMIVGLYLVSLYRQRQRRKLQGVRDRIARDLHDDIGSTLGSISLYSEALKRKLEHHGDATTRAVAEKIGTSSRGMTDRMRDIVWSVDPQHDEAGSLVARMETFSTDLLAANGIVLQFTAPPSLHEKKLGAPQRRNLFLIFKEAMHNVVKHAGCHTVRVELTRSGRDLIMDLYDDGKGFDMAAVDSQHGNGLANMRTRAVAIGGHITIESAPGQGTRIRVVVPITGPVPGTGDSQTARGR